MKKDFTLTLIAALLSVSASAQQPAQHTVLYHNATLLNPATEQQLTDGWLLVKDGRITQLGQQQGDAPLRVHGPHIARVVPAVSVHMGTGVLTAPGKMAVTGDKGAENLTAKHIIVATGARAR